MYQLLYLNRYGSGMSKGINSTNCNDKPEGQG
jgi:hypothetical protein